MAYDSALAERVRAVLEGRDGLTEKKMFGGLAFLLHGNMCCGVLEKKLVLRLGDTGAKVARKQPHTAPMDFTGRPMKSMVYIMPGGYREAAALKRWVEAAWTFARTLPQK